MARNPYRPRPRLPANASPAFAEGWRACEHGKERGANPYFRPGCQLVRSEESDPQDERDWFAGFDARGDRGFSVDHLPRLPGGAFA